MSFVFFAIIVALLIYIIYFMKEGSKGSQTPNFSYGQILPNYLKKTCEIVLKEPLAAIDIMFSVKGVVVDADDEWVMMEVQYKKKKTLKFFRISNIVSIKEFV